MNEKQKPTLEKRFRSVRLTTWRNEDKNGDVFFNHTFVRRYVSGKAEDGTDEWSSSNSYTGSSDLACLRAAVDLAIEFEKSLALGDAFDGLKLQQS